MKKILHFISSLLLLISLSKSISWEIQKTSGKLPQKSENVLLCQCEIYKNSLFVYGGRKTSTQWSSHMNRLDLSTYTWTSIKEVTPYPKLGEHTMTKVSDKFYIYGGRSNIFELKKNMYIFDPESSVMKTIRTTGENPGELRSHAALAIGNEIYYFGGVKPDGKINSELFIFNTETHQWRVPIVFGEKPSGVKGHSLLKFGNNIFLIGGIIDDKKGFIFNNDISYLNIETLNWKKTGKTMSSRAFHSLVVKDQFAFITGGFDGEKRLKDTKVFNLVTFEWVEDLKIDEISPRQGHCAFLKDEKVFLFGGALDWNNRYNDLMFFPTKDFSVKFKPASSWMVNDNEDIGNSIEAAMLKVSLLFDADAFDNKTGKFMEVEIGNILKKYEKKDKDLSYVEKKIGEWKEIEILYNSVFSSIQSIQNLRSSVQVDIDEIEKVKKLEVEKKKSVEKGLSEMQERFKEIKRIELNRNVEKDKLRDIQIELNKSEEKVAEIKKEIEEIKSKLTPLSGDIKKASSEIKSLDEGRSKSRKTFESYEIRFNELKKSNETCHESIEVLKKEKSKLLDDINSFEKDHKNLVIEDDKLSASILKNDTTVAKTDDLKQTLSKVVELIQVYKQKRAKLFNKGDDPAKEKDPLDNVISPKEIEDLDNKVKEAQQNLSKRRNEIKSQKKILESNLKKARRELNENSKNLRTVELKLENALKEITKIETQRLKEKDVLFTLNKDWEKAIQSLEELKEKEFLLNEKLNGFVTKLEELKKEVEEKSKKYSEQVKIENQASEEVFNVKKNLKSKLGDFFNAVTSYESIVSDLQNRRNEIAASHSTVLDQQMMVDKYKKDLNAKVIEIKKECDNKIIELEERVKFLEKQLEGKK